MQQCIDPCLGSSTRRTLEERPLEAAFCFCLFRGGSSRLSTHVHWVWHWHRNNIQWLHFILNSTYVSTVTFIDLFSHKFLNRNFPTFNPNCYTQNDFWLYSMSQSFKEARRFLQLRLFFFTVLKSLSCLSRYPNLLVWSKRCIYCIILVVCWCQ